MKVYVVRHGESETNAKGLWTGWVNVHLTDLGREQAQKVGNFLKDIPFDKIYSSDLVRAMETAENAIPGCSCETSELIREINVGSIAGKPFSVVTGEQRAIIEQKGFELFDGETQKELANRVLKFMKKLEAETWENVALFTHGGWIRAFLDAVTRVHIPKKSVCCKNCLVAIFEYEDDIWRLHSWINI